LLVALPAALGGVSAAAARTPRGCRSTASGKPRRSCHAREVTGGRIVHHKRPRKAAGTGGGADQYLPWDNGLSIEVTQGNGGATSHNTTWDYYGWDFGLRYGANVRAAATGTVVLVQTGCSSHSSWGCHDGWGNTVKVRVADGTCSRYGHLATVNVVNGQQVKRYDPIGTVGESGNADGAHLHYQREACDRVKALPSAFVEVAIPAVHQHVTSRNIPEAPPQQPPVSAPQQSGNPQQTANPQETSNPQPVTGNPQAGATDPQGGTPAGGGSTPSGPYPHTVGNTCWDGACGLTERVGPGWSSTAATGRVYRDGTVVDVVCQSTGEGVGPSPSGHVSSNIWDRLDTGGWVTDLYLDTPGAGAFSPPIPRC
jgi:hypothetical protein